MKQWNTRVSLGATCAEHARRRNRHRRKRTGESAVECGEERRGIVFNLLGRVIRN